MDDEIIKKKLLIDGDGIGDDKRINFFMKSFIKWCDQKGPEDEKSLAVNFEEENLNYEKLIALVGQCEHALNKSTLIQEMNQFEMNYYDELALKIQQTIEQTQIKIEKLKSDLQDAKIIKQNKLIYDEHAEIIFQHPARKQTLKLIEKINNEINRLNEIKHILHNSFEEKKKQFQNLLNELNEFETNLNNQEDLNQEIQLLMDDDYYENLKVDKTDNAEIVLFKDPNSFTINTIKDSREDPIMNLMSSNDATSNMNDSTTNLNEH